MIDVRNDSYTGRSPCHDCQRHLDGLDKNDCVLKCARLAAYRKGEPWEGKEIMEIKDEQFKLCAVEDCDKEVFCRGLCENHYNQWRSGYIEHPVYGKYTIAQPKKNKIGRQKPAVVTEKEATCRGLSMSDYKKWRLGEIEHPTLGKFCRVNHYPGIKPKKKKIETELAPETPPQKKLKTANDSLLRSMTDKITKEVMAEITVEHIAPYLPQEGITLCLDNYPKIKRAVYGAAEKYFLTPEHVIISLLGEALSREGAKAQI